MRETFDFIRSQRSPRSICPCQERWHDGHKRSEDKGKETGPSIEKEEETDLRKQWMKSRLSMTRSHTRLWQLWQPFIHNANSQCKSVSLQGTGACANQGGTTATGQNRAIGTNVQERRHILHTWSAWLQGSKSSGTVFLKVCPAKSNRQDQQCAPIDKYFMSWFSTPLRGSQ